MHDGSDTHWLRLAPPPLVRPPPPVSLTIPMRDGVRIALDVYVPPGRADRVPAVIRQTRYMRSLDARRGASAVARQFDLYARTRRAFLAAGYAWVDVDVRGTGASTGTWAYPWSAEEVDDGAEVVGWIVRQPWSNGKAGALGISYDGTCADMLATRKHPALRAIAPTFALYDVFPDVAFPGGIHLAGFTARWAAYNAALDRNAFPEGIGIAMALMGMAGRASPRPRPLERFLGALARDGELVARRRAARIVSALVRGVRPAGGDASRAPADRRGNMDVHAIGSRVVFRDDAGLIEAVPDGTIDSMSPHALCGDAAASGVAIYSYSGWRDGAYPHSAIKRFLSVRTPGSRLTLGPWVHTGKLEVPAFDVARESSFDHDAELVGFFDEHLRGAPPRGDGYPVHYFTMVEGRWKSARAWPPPASRTLALHLAEGRALRPEPEKRSRVDSIEERGDTGTGVRSRWRSLVSLVPGDYPDRAARDARLLHYDGAPLADATEVTGHPVVHLFLSCSAEDGHVFAYLEDVAPDGRVAYVTEGQLRLLHRRLASHPLGAGTPAPRRSYRRVDAAAMAPGEIASVVFDLLPISWLFERGHRIRLTLAGADMDHFEVMAPRTLAVHLSESHPSRVELPVVA